MTKDDYHLILHQSSSVTHDRDGWTEVKVPARFMMIILPHLPLQLPLTRGGIEYPQIIRDRVVP